MEANVGQLLIRNEMISKQAVELRIEHKDGLCKQWYVGSGPYLNKNAALHRHKLSNTASPLQLVLRSKGKRRIVASAEKESSSMATEIAGVKVINNPPQSKLTDLGVTSWPKYLSFLSFILLFLSLFIFL